MSAPTVQPTKSAIIQAAVLLNEGRLIAVPTETVYGLAADGANSDAVADLYAIKGRPHFNPLIAHVASIEMARTIAEIDDQSLKLIDAFWPGPLTLVCRARPDGPICDLARAGLDTIAIRRPRSTVVTSLIEALGRPIVAPSANRSGRVSPTNAEHVAAEFESGIAMILDDGPCSDGIESTIVRCDGGEIYVLRQGSITEAQIANVVGNVSPLPADEDKPRSPGRLSRHYAPNAELRLNVTSPRAEEGFLGFGQSDTEPDFNLSFSADLAEAASNLYAMLRELDTQHASIAVAPIPETGIGKAINDRLRRAAKRDD